jgi:hypothetical protein
MFEVELDISVKCGHIVSAHEYLVEAAHSRYDYTMTELEHIVAHLLQQWWIFGLLVIYVGEWG